jgi:hypothetical protein
MPVENEILLTIACAIPLGSVVMIPWVHDLREAVPMSPVGTGNGAVIEETHP